MAKALSYLIWGLKTILKGFLTPHEQVFQWKAAAHIPSLALATEKIMKANAFQAQYMEGVAGKICLIPVYKAGSDHSFK